MKVIKSPILYGKYRFDNKNYGVVTINSYPKGGTMELKPFVSEKMHLLLNKEEVRWLKYIMQNPLYEQSPEEEDELDRDMRGRFWNALQEVDF